MFCHVCGQKAIIQKITIKTLIQDISSKWLGWDSKFFRTVKFLTINPSGVIKDYIKGNRVSYLGPLGYLFLITALMVLIYEITGVSIQEIIESNSGSIMGNVEVSESQLAVQKMISEFSAKYFRWISMVIIPFTSLSTFLFYRKEKRKYSYLENLVMVVYLTAHTIWVTILTTPITLYFGVAISLLVSSVSFFYFVYGIYSLHDLRGFKGVLKAILTYSFSTVLFILFLGLLYTIYVIYSRVL